MTNKNPDFIHCNLPAEPAIFAIQSYIEAIEKETSLYEDKNFDQRIEVIDFIDFHVIGQIEGLLRTTDQPNKLALLGYRAEKVRLALEEINLKLFQRLKATIRQEKYTGAQFRNFINEYVDINLGDKEQGEEIGYDNLDIFINGISHFQTIPEQTKDLEPEMVYYQKTPARIVFELAEQSHFTKQDVFFDLGSGLGQVAMLVNLLTGVTVRGIEFEPAFCDYATNCAAELNLSNVTFLNIDARVADYSEGTTFFMFTPFNGKILQEVLEILRKESLVRKIKIITYGPCTVSVASQDWLRLIVLQDNNIYKPGFFSSF